MEKTIIVDGITKDYFGKPVLNGISFKIHHHSIHGLLGPNGAGKSTTMKILAGLLRPAAGTIDWGKENLKCGILTEGLNLYPEMTVQEYLKFVIELYQVPKEERVTRFDNIVQTLHLTPYLMKLISQLSKGFKQRVALAAILVYRPEFIILDEPTVGLDPQSVLELREIIKSLKSEHTIFISSHSLHDMSLLCDEVTILHQGHIKASGKMADIEKMFKKQNLIICHIRPTSQERIAAIHLPNINIVKVTEGQETEIIFENQTGQDQRSKIGQYLIQHGFELLSLEEKHHNLEDIFFEATKRDV